MIEFIRNNPDQVNAFAAMSALFVSLLSIVLTVYTLWLQRTHNFKSLTPIASILLSDYEDNLEVKVRNTGIGPLIIEQCTVSNGNYEKNTLISWMPSLPHGLDWSTFTEEIDGWCLSPDGAAILIQLQGNPDQRDFAEARDKVRKALSQLTVRVEYKDIYDRKMPVKERSLDWFARHFPEEDKRKKNTSKQ